MPDSMNEARFSITIQAHQGASGLYDVLLLADWLINGSESQADDLANALQALLYDLNAVWTGDLSIAYSKKVLDRFSWLEHWYRDDWLAVADQCEKLAAHIKQRIRAYEEETSAPDT